jgi:hypothetical protein
MANENRESFLFGYDEWEESELKRLRKRLFLDNNTE